MNNTSKTHTALRALPLAVIAVGAVIGASVSPPTTPPTPRVITTSCDAAQLPAPYQGVDACSSDAVSCAALSAMFTWNPATDPNPAAGYARARPLIAAGGLHSPDGAPQQPFGTAEDSIGFDTSTAWHDATEHSSALVAYTTRRSQGATRANALFDIVQYRYATDELDAQGNPKPGAKSDGPAWHWWATTITTTGTDGAHRVSTVTQYSPPSEASNQTSPDPAARWACQQPT